MSEVQEMLTWAKRKVGDTWQNLQNMLLNFEKDASREEWFSERSSQKEANWDSATKIGALIHVNTQGNMEQYTEHNQSGGVESFGAYN